MPSHARLPSLTLALVLILGLAACQRQSTEKHVQTARQPPATSKPAPATSPVTLAVKAVDSAVCQTADNLKTQINTLVGQPNTGTLQQAQQAWTQAHLAYRIQQQMQVLAGVGHNATTNNIDATPMLPGYLDSVPGYPASGLVHTETPLTAAYLQQEQQSTDPYFLTLGFHPLAFMLFGSPGDQGGTRKASDFVSPKTPGNGHIDSAARRRNLVQLMAEQLAVDVQPLCADAQVARDSAGLEQTLRVSGLFRRHLATWLNDDIGTRLKAWKANPSGEDNNGVPVSHTAIRGVDFREWQAMLGELASRWVPLADLAERPALQADIKALQRFVTPLAQAPYPPPGKAIDAALESVQQQILQWEATTPAPTPQS